MLRPSVSVLISCLCILSGTSPPAAAHPFCLNNAPPWRPATSPELCTDYKQATCCTPEEERDIVKRYEELKRKMPQELFSKCSRYVNVFLCGRCNPFAGHMIEVKAGTGTAAARESRPLTLCPSECERMIRSGCSPVLHHIFPTVRTTANSTNCGIDLSADIDRDYCYPEFMSPQDSYRPPSVSDEDKNDAHCICARKLAGGFYNPVDMKGLGDGTERYIVVEQQGVLRLIDRNDPQTSNEGGLLYLDHSRHTVFNRRQFQGDDGMLSVAPHPRYKDNGYVYLLYLGRIPRTRFNYGRSGSTAYVVSRFKVSSSNENELDPSSERRMLMIARIGPVHGTNYIMFGPDGYLYIFVGDGWHQESLFPQKMNQPFGKVLRIDVDVDAEDDHYPYYIPRDNPYVLSPHTDWWEIYAIGLRNPWRCSFDTANVATISAGQTRLRPHSTLYCGDVGFNEYEEINVIEKGGNYGWPVMEGHQCQRNCRGHTNDMRDPLISYKHKVGKAVIGGYVYRGKSMPHYYGHYIFADYFTSTLYHTDVRNVTSQQQRAKQSKGRRNSAVVDEFAKIPLCSNCGGICTNCSIVAFANDKQGEMFMITFDAKHNHELQQRNGEIYELKQNPGAV